MIQVSHLPLSSPEVTRLRKWFHTDEANLVLNIVNSEATALEAEMANDIAQSTVFPKHEDYAADKFKQIAELKHFLAVFNRLSKLEKFSTIKLEIKYE
jgi:hypothetical protein